MKIKLLDKYSLVRENLNYHITENEKIIIRLYGKDMATITEAIFPLLTGEYSSNEIAEKVKEKIPQEKTLKIINSLFNNNIVQYVLDKDNGQNTKLAQDLISNLTSDITAAFERLSGFSIGVLGDVDNLEDIIDELNQFKFNKLVVFDQNGKIPLKNNIIYESSLSNFVNSVDFIVSIDTSWVYSKLFSKLNQICLKEEKPWLYCKISSSKQLIVGPIFTGKKICYECLIDRFRSNANECSNLDIRNDNSYEILMSNTTQNKLLLIELKQRILIETIKYLLNVPTDNLVNEIELLDILNFTKKRYSVLPVPKCKCNGDEHLLYKIWDADCINYEKMLFNNVV
jgi:hypothetical protein